jgi:hypothetical protein
MYAPTLNSERRPHKYFYMVSFVNRPGIEFVNLLWQMIEWGGSVLQRQLEQGINIALAGLVSHSPAVEQTTRPADRHAQ